MRVLVAMMKHETNTFSPVPTPLVRFGRGGEGPLYGAEIPDAFRGTGTGLGAFIEIAAREGWDMITPIAASAAPSGPVEAAAYRHMAETILDALAGRPDAIFLDLHGAMVTETLEDGEGHLLAEIRKRAPETPIAVALDMHANLYDAMVANSDVIGGYQTYPHIDTYETGLRAGNALVRMVKGEIRPAMAWGNRPMLPHVMRQGTDDFPNRALQARAREMEAQGAVAVSLFTGFPHADITNAGLSAVVVTDGDQKAAEEMRDELLSMAWREREAFVYRIEPLAASVSRAKADAETARAGGDGRPTILLDHYDNAASGGTMDTTDVLREILRQGLEDVAVFAIHDPEALREMVRAGVGAEVSLRLGGKIPMPQLAAETSPLAVRGRVRLISNGEFRNRGPMGRGTRTYMGPTAVLDTGPVEIVVISGHVEPVDLGCFRSVGIEPTEKQYLMLKSRIHYRASFREIARDVVECAGVGVCTSDYDQLSFRHVRRPIYPLDLVNEPAR